MRVTYLIFFVFASFSLGACQAICDGCICGATEISYENILTSSAIGRLYWINGDVSKGQLYPVENECTSDRKNTMENNVVWYSLITPENSSQTITIESDDPLVLSTYTGFCDSPLCFEQTNNCSNDDDDNDTLIILPADGTTFYFAVSQCYDYYTDFEFFLSVQDVQTEEETTAYLYYFFYDLSSPISGPISYFFTSDSSSSSLEELFISLAIGLTILLVLIFLLIICGCFVCCFLRRKKAAPAADPDALLYAYSFQANGP